ncbi:Uncharacterized protein F13E9.13, mitochondrial [Hypsibius exemplaris]|uniref:Uncharacterized protein F13E9.13, mitochondrial n=1 Tax=Hypsibius exemplaris TaxID=2072580 RepID=A0A9X6RM82_HYPEX|nr:Uncharacterized protein F13E9.13, mitochondrial [Hypsibius exemplaris]
MPTLSKALTSFERVFGRLQGAIIGVVHLPALPGTPKSAKTLQEIVDAACKEATVYFKHGLDGVIVENSNDLPYLKSPHIGPETTAYATRVCTEIRRLFPRQPLGVQVLAGGNLEALAVAHAANLDFIRVEGFVFSSIADEGFIDASAAALLRKRRSLGADDILVFADVKKKHSSHSITHDLTVQDAAEAAEFCLADGVIVTGMATGKAADPQEASTTQKVVQLPVLVGSGVTKGNLHAFIDCANGLIVGSDFKHDGLWSNELDEKRVQAFMKTVEELRKTPK